MVLVIASTTIEPCDAQARDDLSQLSNTSRTDLDVRCSTTTLGTAASAQIGNPRAAAITLGTRVGSDTWVKSTIHAPSGKRSATSRASRSASLVLPTPPTPVKVI